jgi:hypothetical protein
MERLKVKAGMLEQTNTESCVDCGHKLKAARGWPCVVCLVDNPKSKISKFEPISEGIEHAYDKQMVEAHEILAEEVEESISPESMAETCRELQGVQNTGKSAKYYLVHIEYPAKLPSPYDVECSDVIEALNMDFSEAEAFKAIWRKCARKLGNVKPGADDVYDAEKVAHFGARMEAIAKNTPSAVAFNHVLTGK